MRDKRTHASVTNVPCSCNYLRNAAEAPDIPIRFDQSVGEYQFFYDENMLVIYHCPFCGGAAPESKRPQLFAVISSDEKERLYSLLSSITSIDEAIATLGPPDFQSHTSTTMCEEEGQGSPVSFQRLIRYASLSDTAEVDLVERSDGRLELGLRGKFLG
jgi:hypothetical protein